MAIEEHLVGEGHALRTARRMTAGFLRAHAGCTIEIPASADVEEYFRERQIVDALERDASVARVGQLADLHDLPRQHIRRAVTRARFEQKPSTAA